MPDEPFAGMGREMTTQDSFGSDELTPAFVRGATFTEVDGRFDADEVRTFLDRVASALDVFLSGDAQEALRKEFARNAAIAQQVLDAGQNAAQQLRAQAADDAKRILDETREATDRLRGDVEGELEGSKRQVVEMRTRLMGDLRDLHDRIGASLYRFERAVEESPVELADTTVPVAAPPAAAAVPIATPEPEPEPEPAAEPEPVSAPELAPAPASAPEPAMDAAPTLEPIPSADPIEVASDVDIPDVAPPAGAPEPAWTQLPSDAWSDGPADAPEAAPELAPIPVDDTVLVPDPFAVVEDEPLAPGQPLIDLREFGSEPVGDVSDDERAAALLANLQDPAAGLAVQSVIEPSPADAAPAAAPSPAEAAPTVANETTLADSGGDWLATGFDDPMGAMSTEPLAPSAPPAAAAPAAVPAPSPPAANYPPQLGQEQPAPPAAPPAGAPAAASPDAMAVRQLILESFSAGQSREAIEAYLRDNMGFVEPSALIDAALASVEQQPGF